MMSLIPNTPTLHRSRDGKPYLLDVLVERTGTLAESTWYPKVSVAEMRQKKV